MRGASIAGGVRDADVDAAVDVVVVEIPRLIRLDRLPAASALREAGGDLAGEVDAHELVVVAVAAHRGRRARASQLRNLQSLKSSCARI